MRRLWFLSLVIPADTLDVKSWRFWSGLGLAVLGSVGGWKVLGWLYVEIVRDRIDRFIFDARRRNPNLDADLVLAAMITHTPAIDASRLESLKRNTPQLREIIKEALAPDYAAAEQRTAIVAKALQLAEANASAIEGLSAAQLAQGHVLKDVPHMAGVLETVAASIEGFNDSIREMNDRQITTAREVGQILGTIEGIARGYPNAEDRQNYRRKEDRERAAREFQHDDKPTTEPSE